MEIAISNYAVFVRQRLEYPRGYRHLVGKGFEECDMRGSDMRGKTLTFSKFWQCDLRGVNFAGVDLKDVEFDRHCTYDNTTVWPEGYTPKYPSAA